MEKIYFALVDTPGFFAGIIRKVTGIDYIHVALSMDGRLNEAYSIGRRNPFIPLFAGFEKEESNKIVRAFPTAKYRIVSMECTKEQKEQIKTELMLCYQERFRYHYCILGLPFILFKTPFYQENHYTCSSFSAKLLEECGLKLFDKHFSLVTPKDFYELEQTEVEFEGMLCEFAGTAKASSKTRIFLHQAKRKLSGIMNGAIYES